MKHQNNGSGRKVSNFTVFLQIILACYNPSPYGMVSVSTMTYCVVQINCLPLSRFFKEVTMKTAEERYEETWNSYLELLNKDPRE